MDPRDPTTPDPTGQNRRQFLRTTGLATAAAAVGVGTTGSAVAIDEEGEFEATPYSLGVASGDPLPNSVVLWTRLAPEPTQPGFGMPDEAIDLEWTVATDEGMTDDAGNVPGVRTLPGMVIVGPPPVAGGRAPTDPDGDGHYEDVNGNGRLDYDDIQTLFDHFDSDSVRLNEAAYDFNDNGKLEFDDIVTLYREVD